MPQEAAAVMAQVRHTVLFSGRVQGVFFRATTQDVVRAYRVTGFVRNLPDGRVELVAEGEAAELEAFIQAGGRAKADCIGEQTTVEGAATGEFLGFEIRS